MEISIQPLLWVYKEVQEKEKNLVPGEHEVRIKMTQNRGRTYMATGYSSSKENWDFEKNCPETTHPKFKELVVKIDSMVKDIDFEIKSAERMGRIITPVEIKAILTSRVKFNTPTDKPNKIMAYVKMIEKQYRDVDNHGYANIFSNWLYSLKKLLKGKDKMFLAFTKADHEAYEKQISGLSESTISHYLRCYYRIWNLAIKDGICTKDHHPNKVIKFKAYKRIRTKKRSIKSEYWKRILKLKLPKDSRLYRSHLLMQFMYYARGMNFNDIVKLKWENIQNDGIAYKRVCYGDVDHPVPGQIDHWVS